VREREKVEEVLPAPQAQTPEGHVTRRLKIFLNAVLPLALALGVLGCVLFRMYPHAVVCLLLWWVTMYLDYRWEHIRQQAEAVVRGAARLKVLQVHILGPRVGVMTVEDAHCPICGEPLTGIYSFETCEQIIGQHCRDKHPGYEVEFTNLTRKDGDE
jgi:hypothetical protein